ncbi:MAG: hypothetical protein JJ992_29980 [Planctomycetes bacterium]|jgi:hypothetical protein|nr:hypothetical protein [Planctomycetota bacterium]
MLRRSHTAVAIFCAQLVLCGHVFAAPPETDEAERNVDTAHDRECDLGLFSVPVVYKDAFDAEYLVGDILADIAADIMDAWL